MNLLTRSSPSGLNRSLFCSSALAVGAGFSAAVFVLLLLLWQPAVMAAARVAEIRIVVFIVVSISVPTNPLSVMS
jgi:hypothetical protein